MVTTMHQPLRPHLPPSCPPPPRGDRDAPAPMGRGSRRCHLPGGVTPRPGPTGCPAAPPPLAGGLAALGTLPASPPGRVGGSVAVYRAATAAPSAPAVAVPLPVPVPVPAPMCAVAPTSSGFGRAGRQDRTNPPSRRGERPHISRLPPSPPPPGRLPGPPVIHTLR